MIAHEMLVANAGSGKTYALTTRMVTLLALGVEPRKIAALTFTKKAAGEFLDAVFVRLAAAAVDPARLADLCRDTGLPGISSAKCLEILRCLVSQMGALSMGTIDSLFARIARAFPLESGLPGDFAMLGESELESSREDALAGLFRYYARDDDGFKTLLELVRQQSRRGSEREVFSALLDSVSTLHGKFLVTPEAVRWGEAGQIWPSGSAILSAPAPRAAADALWQAIEETHPELAGEAAEAWQENLALAAALEPGDSWPPALADFVKRRLLTNSTDSKTGLDYVPTGRTKDARVYLNARVRPAREVLMLALLKVEIEALLRRSRALHGLMRRFEAVYHLSARAQGKLTFDDVTSLLAGQVEEPEWRAAAGYRLDARFDHWLLDEFQDTSRPQWKVLSAFIDEVVQDSNGERSLFYVGDTKQAIYLWRGGDPGLFFEIRDSYNEGLGSRIEEKSLTQSFRSAPVILDAINRVFGRMEDFQQPLGLPSQAVAGWRRAWREHEVADRNAGMSGYVRWSALEEESSEEDDGSPQDREILKILSEVEPWRRGWSCAVLKRDNKRVASLAALLQSAGVPVAVEGKSNPCTDNPLGACLLAGFRMVASPGDRLAAAVFSGYPPAENLLRCGIEAFRSSTMQRIAAEGFAAACRDWIAHMDLGEEDFLAERAAEFLAAAAEFDARRTASDGLIQFLDFIEGRQVQESEGADVVRVMTVHQAKGLTFDMTVVSGLDELVKDRCSGTLVLGKRGGETAWGMILPPKDLSAQDPVLDVARGELLADSAYGELCTAYVAMTRPRHALYVLTKRPAKSGKGFAALLAMALDSSESPYEAGDARWFETKAPSGIPAESPFEQDFSLSAPGVSTPRPNIPSAHMMDQSPAVRSVPGLPSGRDPAAWGSQIHSALARIEWIGSGAPDLPGLPSDLQQAVASVLADPAVREVFSKPAAPCQLWREQAFDVVTGGVWTSGAFDRVHVMTAGDGAPLSAIIYDFKTDRAPGETLRARYTGQLESYRAAAAQLLGISPASVTAHIVPLAPLVRYAGGQGTLSLTPPHGG